MNRVVALAVAAGIAMAAPKQCQQLDIQTASGESIIGDGEKEYYLVALLKAW